MSEDKGREEGAAVEGGNYEGRLYLLEKQLTDLLQRSRVSYQCSVDAIHSIVGCHCVAFCG